jgi:hypothetical protein
MKAGLNRAQMPGKFSFPTPRATLAQPLWLDRHKNGQKAVLEAPKPLF